MSQQGPILIVSSLGTPPFAAALDDAKMFPVMDATWAGASRAVGQLEPAAVVVAMPDVAEPRLEALANQVAARRPYLPMVAVDPDGYPALLPENAIPFAPTAGNYDRLAPRLRAALRVRALHATVMRRIGDVPAQRTPLSDADPASDATVLLIGRGAAYPALSVSLGERVGVVGAFSIEAAARHLNVRDIDGIVLADGFSARVVDAFLTVLTEDARFRSLPVVVISEASIPAHDLPNLEIIHGEPGRIAARALPLIRQHAFEAHLSRTLRSADAGGLLDVNTGLLTPVAFSRDFAIAVYQTLERGGGLSVARFVFDPTLPRAQLDGARIVSRLMRQMDFGAVFEDGSVVVVFAETDLRIAQAIARRLSSVMRHTVNVKNDARPEPIITLATLQPQDTAKSLLARLYDETRRAAS